MWAFGQSPYSRAITITEIELSISVLASSYDWLEWEEFTACSIRVQATDDISNGLLLRLLFACWQPEPRTRT